MRTSSVYAFQNQIPNFSCFCFYSPISIVVDDLPITSSILLLPLCMYIILTSSWNLLISSFLNPFISNLNFFITLLLQLPFSHTHLHLLFLFYLLLPVPNSTRISRSLVLWESISIKILQLNIFFYTFSVVSSSFMFFSSKRIIFLSFFAFFSSS